MINYIIPVIAAVVVLLLLAVLPLKMGTKLLVKVVVVSLLIFVLTYLLYSLYSLYIAGAGLLFLLLYFSFLISRQQGFAGQEKRVYLPAFDLSSPKQEKAQKSAAAPEKTIEQPGFGKLDQDGIDALMKATADEEAKQKEQPPMAAQVDENDQKNHQQSIDVTSSDVDHDIVSDHDDNFIYEKSVDRQLIDNNQGIVTNADHASTSDGDSETKFVNSDQNGLAKPDEQVASEGEAAMFKLTIEDLHDAELETFESENSNKQGKISSKENNLEKAALLEINSSELETSATVDNEQEETTLAADIESALEDFRTDIEPPKKAINQSDQLFDIELNENEDELEEFFEGRNRDVILADEEVEADKEELVIYDRGIIDEIETITETPKSENRNIPQKQLDRVPTIETNSNQTDSKDSNLKANILQKRSKLFAELEDEM